jgi:hypothetical protein
LKCLASQEDIADVINLYQDCFNPSAGDTSQLVAQLDTVPVKFGISLDGADPGMEVESTMSLDVLSRNLGFRNGTPLLFNHHRHKGGLNSWDNTSSFQEVESNQDFVPIRLHWHQQAGVRAILRRLLSREPSSVTPGILVADEVGLGKTLQAVALLAWLTECVGRQSSNSSQMPPILGMLSLFPFGFG